MVLLPSRQVIRRQARLGKSSASCLAETGSMLGVATDQRRSDDHARSIALAAAVPRSRWPEAGGGLDADDIGQAEAGDAVAEVGVDAVACVGQDDRGVDPGGQSGAKLAERDLRLGLEDDIVRHACLARRSGSSAHSCGRYRR